MFSGKRGGKSAPNSHIDKLPSYSQYYTALYNLCRQDDTNAYSRKQTPMLLATPQPLKGSRHKENVFQVAQ
jgi:hypothetical protein